MPDHIVLNTKFMDNNNTIKEAWWKPGLSIFAQMSGWIAGPVIVALFIGKFLDNYFQTKPVIFIACMILAFTGSIISIVNISHKYIKKIENSVKEKNDNRIN